MLSVVHLGGWCVLWRFCRSGELREVLRLLDEVRKSGSASGFNWSILVVHVLCSKGRVEEAVYVLDELRGRVCKPDFNDIWIFC